MRLVLLALASLLVASASAQTPGSAAPADTTVYTLVEQVPELIGGIEALQARVVYPEAARRAGVEGMVYVQFVVNEQGQVTDAHCPRAPSPLLCDAARDAVLAAQFEPGFQDGRPVKVLFTVPVNFRLKEKGCI